MDLTPPPETGSGQISLKWLRSPHINHILLVPWIMLHQMVLRSLARGGPDPPKTEIS